MHLHVVSMGIINKSSYSESTQQLHIQNRYVQQNPESFSVHQQFGSRRACLQLQSEQLGDAYFLCQLPKFHFRLGFAHVQYITSEGWRWGGWEEKWTGLWWVCCGTEQ